MGLRVSRIMKFIEPDFILLLIEQPVVRTNAADLFASEVCLKCMKEVGVQAEEILALQVSHNNDVALRIAGFSLEDIALQVCHNKAVALRAAGFSLEDLMRARDLLHLAIDPPVTNRTLFDSQLKAAGFSACDFAKAGYEAVDLSPGLPQG